VKRHLIFRGLKAAFLTRPECRVHAAETCEWENALAPQLDAAIAKACANIRKIRVVGSYFRTDIGQSLWPPGTI